VSIDLIPIKEEKRNLLEAMMLQYFKEIDIDKVIVRDGKELIEYPYLSSYWTDEKRMPFFIIWDQKLAGFALINDWAVHRIFDADLSVAEFYVAPSFRRKGIAQKAVQHLFRRLTGKWEVRQSATNLSAVNFWRNTINAHTKGNFQEVINTEEGATEIIQLFTT